MSQEFRSWSIIFYIIGLLLLNTSPGIGATDCVLRVGWDQWPPYISKKDGKFNGPEFTFLQQNADASGCKLKMIQAPWARALKMLETQRLDLLYGAGHSAERAQYAKFSIPYRQEHFDLVTLATKRTHSPSISLSQWIRATQHTHETVKIGIFRGDFYGKEIERILTDHKSHIDLIPVDHNEQLSRMLDAGRLHGYFIEHVIAQHQRQASTIPLTAYAIHEQPGDPLHYMFGRHISEKIISQFNQAIQSQQQSFY